MTYDGLDHRALARQTGAHAVILKPVVNSVLDIAHGMGQGGAPSGTLILAEQQTDGRGRQGRRWHSAPGGIWMALLLRPKAAPSGGSLGIRAGLATVEALAAVAPTLAPRLKWPNDVMIKGRKAAGVLCEARWSGESLSWVAVGIGINVRGALSAEIEERSVNLGDLVPGITRVSILTELVPRLVNLAAAEATLGTGEQAAFLRLAWRTPGETVEGVAPDGALLVRAADGTIARRTAAE